MKVQVSPDVHVPEDSLISTRKLRGFNTQKRVGAGFHKTYQQDAQLLNLNTNAPRYQIILNLVQFRYEESAFKKNQQKNVNYRTTRQIIQIYKNLYTNL